MQWSFCPGLCRVIFLALVVLINARVVNAAGFGVFTHGASALGQANAVVAHSDVPEAIFFNPALLSRLTGTQVQIGTTLIVPDREFKSDLTGASEETENVVFFPSNFYLSHAVNDKLSAGIGVFNPFGLGTEWPDDWEGRFLATESTITTYNLNPVLTYQLNQAVSVAAGVDFVILDATLESIFSPTGRAQKFSGDGTGLGYNLGVLVDLTGDLSFGLSYRSEVDIDIEGKSESDIPMTIPEPQRSTFAGLLNSDAKADLTLPAQAYAGLAFKGIDRLVIEAGVRWEEWSSFEELRLRLDNGIVATQPKDWDDTWSYNLGGKYQLNDTVALLAGYLYGANAVPDDTVEPGVPDSVSHMFSLGTDLSFGRSTVSLSYGYQHLERRDKDNTIVDSISKNPATSANGKYQSDLHLAGVSYAYRF